MKSKTQKKQNRMEMIAGRALRVHVVRLLSAVLLFAFVPLTVQTPSFSAPAAAPAAINGIQFEMAAAVEGPESAATNGGAFAISKTNSKETRAALAADLLKDAVEDAGDVVTAALSLGGSLVGLVTIPGMGQAIGGTLGAGLGGALEGMAVAAIEKRSGNDFWFQVWRSIGRAVAKNRAGVPILGGNSNGLAEMFVRVADRLDFPTQTSRDFVAGLKSFHAVVLVQVDRAPAQFGSALSGVYIKEGNLDRGPRASDIHSHGPPQAESAFDASFLYSGQFSSVSILSQGAVR